MANQTSFPYSIAELTEKYTRELKLYNSFHPQSKRKTNYGQLRTLRVSRSQASRVRDWSDSYIKTFIENHLRFLAGDATG